MKRYDASTRRIAMKARADGVDYGWIAANIGPSTRTLQMWARQDGLPRRSSAVPGTPTPADRQEAVRLYRGGWRARDVAEIYEVDQRTINKWDRQSMAMGSETT